MPKIKNPKEDSSLEKPPIFSRGYSKVRERVEKNPRFNMSCYNCEYYYQASGDKEEVCQNPEVLKYDIVVTETTIYCNRWKMCQRKGDTKSLFKSGRGNK